MEKETTKNVFMDTEIEERYLLNFVNELLITQKNEMAQYLSHLICVFIQRMIDQANAKNMEGIGESTLPQLNVWVRKALNEVREVVDAYDVALFESEKLKKNAH